MAPLGAAILAAAGVEVLPLRGMILYTKKSRSRVTSWRQKTKNVKAIIAWSCFLLESATFWILVIVSRMFA